MPPRRCAKATERCSRAVWIVRFLQQSAAGVKQVRERRYSPTDGVRQIDRCDGSTYASLCRITDRDLIERPHPLPFGPLALEVPERRSRTQKQLRSVHGGLGKVGHRAVPRPNPNAALTAPYRQRRTLDRLTQTPHHAKGRLRPGARGDHPEFGDAEPPDGIRRPTGLPEQEADLVGQANRLIVARLRGLLNIGIRGEHYAGYWLAAAKRF